MTRIMILDDNACLHQLLDAVMSKDEVTHCYTHEGAMLILKNDARFDTVYLDYCLGRLSTGFDTAKFIVESLPKSKWPKKVIVHSCDSIVGRNMAKFLMAAGVSAEYRMFGG